MDPTEFLSARARSEPPARRPWVTLSYAQTLDGSLAASRDRRLAISSPEAEALTHRLRAQHDAVLVGIGTVLADDPRLTVRHTPGPSPRPVILDSRLRTPEGAHVWEHPLRPWFAVARPGPERTPHLRQRGAEVLEITSTDRGLDLFTVLEELRRRGVRRLMVEGGPTVLTSFLRSRLADWMVVTVAPRLLAGVRLAGASAGDGFAVHLQSGGWRSYGADTVVWGEAAWGATQPA
jgi:3,4-dihydroxy 2-butanone 4-phosphate synthase/GTP cyclohydrolase II